MTKVQVVEVTERTNKNGEPYWDIKVEEGGRAYAVRDRIPRVEWQASSWYEVELGQRQPIAGQPGKYYLAEVLLAEPIDPPQAMPPSPIGSGRYTIDEVEEFRRQHALAAAAMALGPSIDIERAVYSGEQVADHIIDLATRLLPFLRGDTAQPRDINSTPSSNAPVAPSTRVTPPPGKAPSQGDGTSHQGESSTAGAESSASQGQLGKVTDEQIGKILRLTKAQAGGLIGFLKMYAPDVLSPSGAFQRERLTWLQAEKLLTILEEGKKGEEANANTN